MRAKPFSAAIVVGTIAASSTTGALVAMGRRAGHAAIPFAAIGAVAFQRTADSGVVGLVFTGFVLHVAAMFVWAFVYVWIAERTRRPITTAITVATVNFLVSWLVAWSTGRGVASVLPLGDRIVFGAILAASYIVGMRYAFSTPRNA
ncbi:MAG TPA: hypothetical protein VIP11_18175 [Gemmatimonadaceae bacterium]